MAAWTRWVTWKTPDGEDLRVGWTPGGDAGAMIGERIVAHWPDGAMRRGSLDIPGSRYSLFLPTGSRPAEGFHGEQRLVLQPGATEAARSVGLALVLAGVVDALAIVSWLAQTWLPWDLAGIAVVLFICGFAARNGNRAPALVGVAALGLEVALHAAIPQVTQAGLAVRAVLLGWAGWQTFLLLARSNEEPRRFPGPAEEPPERQNATAGEPVDTTNPFSAPRR